MEEKQQKQLKFSGSIDERGLLNALLGGFGFKTPNCINELIANTIDANATKTFLQPQYIADKTSQPYCFSFFY